MAVDKKFIVNLQGKEFVTYEGLLSMAHEKGLMGIQTQVIQLPTKDNGGQCIVKASAVTKEGGVFEGYGDADPLNVNKMIAKHLIRMAETRAKARALRDLTNIGMTAIEELGGDDASEKNVKASFEYREPAKAETPTPSEPSAPIEDEPIHNGKIKTINFMITRLEKKGKSYDLEAKVASFGKDTIEQLTKAEGEAIIVELNELVG